MRDGIRSEKKREIIPMRRIRIVKISVRRAWTMRKVKIGIILTEYLTTEVKVFLLSGTDISLMRSVPRKKSRRISWTGSIIKG